MSLGNLGRLALRTVERRVLAITIEKRGWRHGYGRIREREVIFADDETHFFRKMLRRQDVWLRISTAEYVRKSLPPPRQASSKGTQ